MWFLPFNKGCYPSWPGEEDYQIDQWVQTGEWRQGAHIRKTYKQEVAGKYKTLWFLPADSHWVLVFCIPAVFLLMCFQDLYTALQKFNFKREHIEEAMKSSILYGGDLHSALDWLCLNLKDGNTASAGIQTSLSSSSSWESLKVEE